MYANYEYNHLDLTKFLTFSSYTCNSCCGAALLLLGYHRILLTGNMEGATCKAGHAYAPGAPDVPIFCGRL